MPDTFSRDDIATYEKQAPAAVADPTPDPDPAVADDEQIDADPAGDDTPDPDADPSTADDDTAQPGAGDDDSSADTSADPATADADSESETGKPAPKPAKGSAAERIQGLVAKGKEKDVTIESLKQLNQDLLTEFRKAVQPGVKPIDAPVVPVVSITDQKDDPQPTIDQFEYDPVKHGAALNEWFQKQVAKTEQRILSRVMKGTAEANEVAQAGAIFKERTAEFAKTVPNFEEVTKGKSLPTFDPRTAKAIVTSPQGPAVHFELLQNPKEAARIAALDPADQLLAIGELAGQAAAKAAAAKKPVVADKKPAQKKKVTGAPPPPRPNPSGASPHVKNMLDGSLSMEDWVNADRTQKLQQREARNALRKRMR